MVKQLFSKRCVLAAILAVGLTGVPADAARVDLDVSTREVYVGVPFQIRITITNGAEYETPRLPAIDGLRSLSNRPSTRSEINILQGRQSSRMIYIYQYEALAPGKISIPEIAVVVDGAEYRTEATQIIASEIPQGPDEGALLFLEVKSESDVYYLGQTIELTLEIWLLPYFDDRYTVRLDVRTMFDQLNVQASRWGVFRDALNKNITAQEIVRTDGEGLQRAYYVYSVKRTFSPLQSGDIPLDDVRVVVSYPTRIRRSRSLLTGGWETTDARPIAAAVERPAIRIESPPMQGRPPTFAGAVGQFEFRVSAKPTEVAVGDPITLTLTIQDRSQLPTDMGLLKPPNLEADDDLTRDFRIAGDPPAGIVAGRRKSFTQTIRARNDAVTAVPPVPFSYFDPQRREYVTVSSTPISLQVDPAVTMADSWIVGAEGEPDPTMTELAEVEGGILANYSGESLVLASQTFAFTWTHGLAVVLPPIAFSIVVVGKRRALRLKRDGGHARRRRARRNAIKRLGDAQNAESDRQAILAAAAVSEYVADRYNLPAGALTSAEVLERLARGRVPPGLLQDVEQLLADCEQQRYAGHSNSDTESFAQSARRCIDGLERERLR